MSAAVFSLTPPTSLGRSSSVDAPLTGLDAAGAYLGLDPDELVAWLDHGGTLPVLARALGRSGEGALEIVVERARAALRVGLTSAERERELAALRRRIAAGDWHPRSRRRATRLAA